MPGIDRLLHGTMQMKGSDLHLSPEQPARVRVRGSLTSVSTGALTSRLLRGLFDEILDQAQKDEFAQRKELDFVYVPAALGGPRFRVNLFEGRLGAGAVVRVIPSKIPTAQELGLPEALLRMCNLDRGLVLVTGATGSGKSTTLAAMVDWINENKDEHILTLEDPIEFAHHSKRCLVNQREVGAHTHSFSAALKSALREDPDTILVGEMRDLETIELALTAAETGHLVFGTLHTSSAHKTIDRVINVFSADKQEQIRTLLGESLKGVIAQKLLPSTDGGRVAALEILVVNSATGNLIREGKTYQIPTVMQTGRGEGMQTMEQAIEALHKAGRISAEIAAEQLGSPAKKPAMAVVR